MSLLYTAFGIIAGALGVAVFFIVLRKQRTDDGGGALGLIQNQINEIARMMD